jgi:hypothetical protein
MLRKTMELVPEQNKIAIIMAVYQPNEDFFYQQLFSIKKQTHNYFICFCLGDGPHEELFAHAQSTLDDSRFQFISYSARVGFYENFKRGLTLITEEFSFIAFSDQDDVWHSDNLEKKISHALKTNAELVYTDARLIDEYNNLIAPSFYKYSELAKYTSLIETLLINNVIGMSMLFTPRVLKLGLPIPPQSKLYRSFHDWWFGLVSLATVKTSFLNDQTIDYRQHSRNLVGSGSKRTWIRKLRTCVRCVVLYPFYPKYCIVRYCKRNLLHKHLQRTLMTRKNQKQKVNHLRLTLKDLLKTLKQRNTKLFSFCWLMILAQLYLAFKPTRKMALKLYRRVKSS